MNKTYQRIALCSLSVILAAQLSVNLFFADFAKGGLPVLLFRCRQVLLLQSAYPYP